MYCGQENNCVKISSRHAFSSAYLFAARRDYPTSHNPIDEMNPMFVPIRQRARLAGSGVSPDKLKPVVQSHRMAQDIGRHRTQSSAQDKNNIMIRSPKNSKAVATNQIKNKSQRDKEAAKCPHRKLPESSSESSDEEAARKAASTDSVQLKRFVTFVNDTVSETVQKSVSNSIRSFFEDTSKKIADLSVQMLSNECLLSKMYLDIIEKFSKQNQGRPLQNQLPRRYRNTLYHSDGNEEDEEDNDFISDKEETMHSIQYNEGDEEEDEMLDSSNEQSCQVYQRKHPSTQCNASSRSSSEMDIKEVPEKRSKLRKTSEPESPAPPPPAPPMPISIGEKNSDGVQPKTRRSKKSQENEEMALHKSRNLICTKCKGIRSSEKRSSRCATKICRCHCFDDEETSSPVRSPSPPTVQERVKLFDSLKSGHANASRFKNASLKKGIAGSGQVRTSRK